MLGHPTRRDNAAQWSSNYYPYGGPQFDPRSKAAIDFLMGCSRSLFSLFSFVYKGIRTRFVREEGEHAHHLVTTTAHQGPCCLNLYRLFNSDSLTLIFLVFPINLFGANFQHRFQVLSHGKLAQVIKSITNLSCPKL